MKQNTIWIIVGVIALILIIANWNKLFGKKNGITTTGTGTGGRFSEISGQKNKYLNCVNSFEQDLKGLASIYTPPTSGPPSVTYNWGAFSSRLNQLKTCVSQ